MTLIPLDPFGDQPAGFNHAAASVIFDRIMKMDDDEAQVFSIMVLGEALATDLTAYDDVICKALVDHLQTHGERMRQRLVDSYVSKRLDGADVAPVVAAAEQLAKAFEGFDFSPAERARRAHQQQRDLASGQFVRAHAKIETGKLGRPHGDRHAERLGIKAPNEAVNLTPAQKARYQEAYRQVAEALSPYARREERDPGSVSAHFVSRSGALGEPLSPDEALEALADDPRRLPAGISGVSVSVLPAAGDLNASPYDTLRDLGGSIAGTYGGDRSKGMALLDEFNTNRAGGDAFNTGSRLFARLYAGSKLLDDSLGDAAPKKVQLALKVGQHVGTYGPEAQKVIGPTADRAAYRYRGTEREPDRRLTTALESLRRSPNIKPEDKREVLIHGVETDTGWKPSGVLSYFRSRLPSADLNTLQRKSGTIPPSEGVILDRSGKLVTQAVGYGDDHYLPFNLKNLKGLRGGEYIRTRTWGGPTTEDVYTGLISGAKAITVASHNGVYSVEFDKSFKGGRRYNDKAARMVARYGQLLDAVKNGEITTGQIDPSRLDELAAKAESSYDRDTEPAKFEDELDRLRTAEMRNPKFSAAQRAQAGASFLDNEALKHRTPDGHEMTRTELVDSWLNEQAGQRYRAYRAAQADEELRNRMPADKTAGDFKREIAQQNGLDDPDPVRFSANAVAAMGMTDRYDRFVEREEQTYRDSLKPLQLNGPGYQLALNALREQFPYYIDRVEFHPWTDARNGRDTGYVKPKHNRPAAVLSGYFDSDLGGKVRAHTTRYQGSHTQPERYQSRTERLTERAKQTTARLGTGGTDRPLDPRVGRELRMEADRSMLDELKQHTHFSSGAHNAGDTGMRADLLHGKPVTEFAAALGEKHPALSKILTTDRDSLHRELADNPEDFHRRLKAAVDSAEKHSLFDLNTDVKRAFRAEGKPTQAKKVDRDDVGELLRSVETGTDIDFGQAALDPDRSHGTEALQATYAQDKQVENAVAALGLPAKVDDPEFADKARAAGEGLRARNRAWLDWAARGNPGAPKPKDHDRLARDAEGLARAVQLHRMFVKAAAAEKAAEPVAVGGGTLAPITVEYKFPPGFVPPGELGAQARAGRLNPVRSSGPGDLYPPSDWT